MRSRTNKQPSRASAFHVLDGTVVVGSDPTLSLVEIDGVRDLVLTRALPDGWYRRGADGITRSLTDLWSISLLGEHIPRQQGPP